MTQFIQLLLLLEALLQAAAQLLNPAHALDQQTVLLKSVPSVAKPQSLLVLRKQASSSVAAQCL